MTLPKVEDSLFMIEEEDFNLYKQVQEELAVVALVMPDEPYIRMKYQLSLDYWLFLQKKQLPLENYESKMIYPIRAYCFEQLTILSIPTSYQSYLQNPQFAYIVTIHLVTKMVALIIELTAIYKDFEQLIHEMGYFQNKDLAVFFDEHFQSIEQYPKDLAQLQRRFVVEFSKIVPKQHEKFQQAIEEAFKEALAIYQLLY